MNAGKMSTTVIQMQCAPMHWAHSRVHAGTVSMVMALLVQVNKNNFCTVYTVYLCYLDWKSGTIEIEGDLLSSWKNENLLGKYMVLYSIFYAIFESIFSILGRIWVFLYFITKLIWTNFYIFGNQASLGELAIILTTALPGLKPMHRIHCMVCFIYTPLPFLPPF